jgi:phosphatidylserine/phosphatidylglycerophosphate/cardiolipin synthase-like enzyme
VLRELFVDRWSRSEGPPLVLPECQPQALTDYAPRGALPLGARQVALSRTDPRGPREDVREVEALLIAAIGAAEQLIYIETQYFSSRAIADALVERMRQAERPHLQIIVILNEKPEAVKEEIAVGLRQAKILTQLATVAEEAGHSLGVYASLCEGDAPERPATYIHSKLLCVDDRFLTVGSANLTNRSMGVDTELNVSWELASDEPLVSGDARPEPLIEGIRAIRVSLLAEHTGLAEATTTQLAAADLATAEGLVERLDRLSAQGDARLKKHSLSSEREQQVMELVDPEALPFDPAQADYDAPSSQSDHEPHSRGMFVGGLSALWDRPKPGAER